MQMQLNDFRYFYYLGSTYEFDEDWIELDSERYSLQNPYANVDIDKSGYSIFSNKTGDLILAFNVLNDRIIGNRVYDYRLFVDNEIFVINNSHYSLYEELIDKPKSSEKGIFIFSKSGKVSYDIKNNEPARCDFGSYGPIAFSGPSGASAESFDFQDPAPVSLSKTYRASPIISAFDIGHIVYMEVADDKIELQAVSNREVPCITRTLSEQLKLISEWSVLASPPFDSKQDIALCASKFVDITKMSKELLNDLEKNQADMQVIRYLKGNKDARKRPALNEIKKMTNVQKKWVASKFIFKGFDKMKTVLG